MITVNEHTVECCRLRIPNVGPWWAEVDCTDEAARAVGRVELRIGEVSLVGSVDIGSEFAGTRRMRIVAGAGGWQTALDGRAYHNDAGVPRRLIADDAARAAGETIGTFEPTSRLPVDYVRPPGSAAATLEYAAGGTPWWVDFAGVTHVGARPAAATEAKVLTYNPREQFAELNVDRIDAVGIGAVISDRLDPPITVRDIEVEITSNALRFRVWHSDSSTARAPLARVITSIVERATDQRLLGAYTYRVIRMVGDRVSLQAVRKDLGLPDLPHVSMWSGAPGVHASLSPGAEVLVSFRDGDRRSPVITHHTGKGGLGFVPVSLDLCGNGNGLPIARQGDLVISGGIGTVVTMWPVTGVPPGPNAAVVAGVPHMISFDAVVPTPVLAAPLVGATSSGSSLLRGG